MEHGIYFGLDICSDYTMVSFYQLNMDEPTTLSTVVGSEAYQIPTFVAKKKGIGQWFFGKEAKNQVMLEQAIGVDELYERAVNDEMVNVETDVISARELLALFIKRLVGTPGRIDVSKNLCKLVITVEELSMQVVSLFQYVAEKLSVPQDKLVIIDHKESFYYYALSQEPRLFLQDVMLYHYEGEDLHFYQLHRNTNTRPQVVTFREGVYDMTGRDKDQDFRTIVRQDFAGQAISAVYLSGGGFDGDWMKLSLQEICKGRRAFLGKNLYTKGACYAGAVKDNAVDWPFIYMGDNELKLNLSLKVSIGNDLAFETLLSAGDCWYDSYGECEVILDGSPEVECWIQKPDSREARIQLLELTDLPERESRTTRLRISAKPTSDSCVDITIRDLGFGEIVPATNQIWNHTIELS